MRYSTTLLLITLWLLVPGRPANAQSENCSTEPSVDGSTDLGVSSFSVAPTPISNDFSMMGTGCVDFVATFFPGICASDPGFDNVVCFTPTNDCDILLDTSTGGQGSSANVFSGTCQEPSECIASAASPAPYISIPILVVSLTGGTQYCIVWERCGDVGNGLSFNQVNGTDCGALPAELLSFTVASEGIPTTEPSESDGKAESGSLR